MSDENENWADIIKGYIDSLEIKSAIKLRNDLVLSIFTDLFDKVDISLLPDEDFVRSLKKLKDIKIDYNKFNEKKELDKILSCKAGYAELKELKAVDSVDEVIYEYESKVSLYSLWINHAISRMHQVTNATHVAKLTHSSSGGLSMIDGVDSVKKGYISTSLLDQTIYDGAYPNSDLSKVAKFLLLKKDGITLADELRNGNVNIIKELVDSPKELVRWQEQFVARLNPAPKADALAKQVYFPVADDYHLLVVMKSSSLIQKIYDDYFHKDIRKVRDKLYRSVEKEKYSAEIYERIPNVTTFATVQKQPQNVSVLHGSRGGNIRLFSCEPPQWQSQLRPPLYRQSLFHDRLLNAMAAESIKGLKDLLMTFENANISFKEPNRYRGIANRVRAIANILMDYAQIMLAVPAGWSANKVCRLPVHHRYFLDAYRDDANFITAKQQAEWQKALTQDFVEWLNAKLAGKQKTFIARKEHGRVWRNLFAVVLREYQEDMDALVSTTPPQKSVMEVVS